MTNIDHPQKRDPFMRSLILKQIESQYHAIIEHPWQKYPDDVTAKEPLSGKWFAVFMQVRGDQIGLLSSNLIPIMNVKAEPDFIHILENSEGFAPAYHMNKEHWITVRLDGSIAMEQVMRLIRESYEMLCNTPTRRIYEAVKKIPRGKVATYAQVAEMAGNPRMSRAVGNALHKNPDPDHIPCYRVVNSKGELASHFAFGGQDVQKKLLEADGIKVTDGRVDLNQYGIS